MRVRVWAVTVLLVLSGIVTLYAIFNVGNPHSLLRWIIPAEGYDLYVAMGGSLVVFFLGFLLVYFRQQEGFAELLKMNRTRIRELRRKGYSDEQIAEDLLAALGMKKGYRYAMTKRRLVLELSAVPKEE